MYKEKNMHKFFCNYNDLTQRYELSKTQNFLFNRRIEVQKENNLLGQIKANLQALYDLIVAVKEGQNEENLLLLEESELLISNLFHSLFASPLEIDKPKQNASNLQKALELVYLLERDINIPEYNRIILLVKNNLQNLERRLTPAVTK